MPLDLLPELTLSNSAMAILEAAQEAEQLSLVGSIDELMQLAVPEDHVDPQGYFTVGYDIPGRGFVPEVKVCRVNNGIAANYVEPVMRRRDPNCMVIADKVATDKPTFDQRFNKEFEPIRQETFEWLKNQPIGAFFFETGLPGAPLNALAICPANAAFFALGLAMLQGIVPLEKVKAQSKDYFHGAIVYVAPAFRHTHFDGKQVVVHNRRFEDNDLHELFSYNLYPGPSAKKGVYGMLLTLGERADERWTTAHCSTVQVITPYDNVVTIMHEGASGGGKSEMLEQMHRAPDGRVLLGVNTVNGETRYSSIPRGCELRPVTDDMALCHAKLQTHDPVNRKLTLIDAEQAWFIRVNHIASYGVDPALERLTIHPPGPLLFLNIKAEPNSTALIWEHIQDAPGKPCPNPRVIMPRDYAPGVVNEPVSVDIRSFGVRCPPCTREQPTYGIISLFHVLPPALAWLWRLVAPRGFANPSIVDSVKMESEGVGSYWPFATGRKVDQANILLEQILSTSTTSFVLIPNQHIGCWKVGFAPQWVAREYLARRGQAPWKPGDLREARCPILGYRRERLQVEGQYIGPWFLNVYDQPEVGEEGYDAGAKILLKFFHEQLHEFESPDLAGKGREIIQACLDGCKVTEYDALSK